MTSQVIPIQGLDKAGVVIDSPSIQLSENAFSDARNIRFDDGAIRKVLGELEIFPGHAQSDILAIEYWDSPIGSIYVLAFDTSLVLMNLDTDGTPNLNTLTNTFTTGGSWQFTTFNGGYSFIANNGIDTPVHITATQASTFSGLTAADLPGWDSYTVGSDTVSSVSAGIVIAAGNFLIASDLVERDSSNNIIRELRGVVRSSDVATPGNIPQNWNPFATGVNTADELLLADTGRITAAIPLQGRIFVFTASSIHQVEVTLNGLRTVPITEQYGALSLDAVFEFDGRLLVIGSNDIYTFEGHPASIRSISDGRTRRYFYNNLNPIFRNVEIRRNLEYDEIWIAFSNLSSTTGQFNEALLYNYRDDTWTIRDLPNLNNLTLGAIPGGGISGATVDFEGTGNTGQFGLLTDGTQEVQTLTITEEAVAEETAIGHQSRSLFTDPSSQLVFEDQEIIDLVVTGDADPSLTHAVNTIDFTGVTPNSNSAVAGGTRLTIAGTNPASVTIDGSSFTYTDGNLTSYLGNLVNYINSDNVTGLEDYTATFIGSVVTLTSDVQGPRTITSATVTTYTGTVVQITQATVNPGITVNSNTYTPATVDLTGTSGVVGVPFQTQPTYNQGTGTTVATQTNAQAAEEGAITTRDMISEAQLFVGGYWAHGFAPQTNEDLTTSYTVARDGMITIVATGGGSGGPDNAQDGRAGGWGHFTFDAEENDVINVVVAGGVPADGDFAGFGGSGAYRGRTTTVTYTRGGTTLWTFNSGVAPSATGNGAAVSGAVAATVTGSMLPTQVALGSIPDNSARTVANRQGYFAQITGINNPNFNNRNAFDVDGGGWGAGAYNGGNLQHGWAAPGAVAIWQEPIGLEYSITNNRPAGLQQDVFSFMLTNTASGDVLNFGNIDMGDTTAVMQIPGESDAAHTWGAEVLGTQVDNWGPSNASGSVTGIGGSTVDITRSAGTPITGPAGTGTGSGSAGGITVTVSPSTTFNQTISNVGADGTGGFTTQSIGGVQAGDTVTVTATSGGTNATQITWANGVQTGFLNRNDSATAPVGGTATFYASTGGTVSIRLSRTITSNQITFQNTNSYDVTLTAASTGGARTIAAGATVTVQAGGTTANQNWVIASNNIDTFDFTALNSDTTRPAQITSVTTDGTTSNLNMDLTGTAQTIVTGDTSGTISLSGTYTVVSGTASPSMSLTPAGPTVGNGVYGVADADAPNISLRMIHTGVTGFPIEFPPFPVDSDTPEEFRDHIINSISNYPALLGLDPNIAGVTQPGDAVFYVTTEGNAVRFIAVDTGDTAPIAFEAFTFVNGNYYDETAFGGNVMESVTVDTQGMAGTPAPVIQAAHPVVGNILTALFGTYDTGEEIATAIANILDTSNGYDAETDGSGDLIVTRTVGDLMDHDIVWTYTQNDPGNYDLPTARTTRDSVFTNLIPPTISINSPEGTSVELSLADLGTVGGMITSEEIAGGIRDNVTFPGWTVGGSGANVTFTSFFDPVNPIDNGVYLSAEMLEANVTPGYTGQVLGRAVDGLFDFTVVDYGNTGTDPMDFDGETAVETTAGVDATYSRDGSITIILERAGVMDTTVLPLSNLDVTAAFNAVVTSLQSNSNIVLSTDASNHVIIANTAEYNPDGTVFLQVIYDGGTYADGSGDSTLTANVVFDDRTDPERPWATTVFNTARQFLVGTDGSTIYAFDLSYGFNGQPINSYVERKRLHISPTKDTEMLAGVYLDIEGGPEDNMLDADGNPEFFMNVQIDVTGNASQIVDLSTDGTAYRHEIDDYKSDVRKTGRLLNIRISNNSTEDFIISGMAIEVGKAGTR